MKEYKQLGAYGIIIESDNILLVKKKGGPYDGKLDLPGGTIEFCETPVEALKRELNEEVGIEVKDYNLYDSDSVSFEWQLKDEIVVKVHHIGIFYKIINYTGNIQKQINIDNVNDDSLGAEFYEINLLEKKNLSKLAILELEKLGYILK